MRKYILIFIILIGLVSCNSEGLMEKTDTDQETAYKVFTDKEKTIKALTHLYGSTWFCADKNGGFNVFNDGGYSFLECATDEAKIPGDKDPARNFTMSTLTAEASPFLKNPWQFYYQAIRSANVFLMNIHYCPVPESEQLIMADQVRLLRALYYHELFRFYGALVLVGNDVSEGMQMNYTRSTLEETVKYIVDELDYIIYESSLPEGQWSGTDFGRVTKGVAAAYKARTLLYAASPLNSDDSQDKWGQARDAAQYLMNSGWYELYKDPVNEAESYARVFNTRVSKEIILAVQRGKMRDLYNNLPSGEPWSAGVTWPGTGVTFNYVDGFGMMDGQVPVLGYNADGSVILNPNVNNYDDAKPFLNRDPRLEKTILHHGSTWKLKGQTVTLDITKHTVGQPLEMTNIVLRKFLDDRIDHMNNELTDMNFPMMRYAEVLLIYVEAANEAGDAAGPLIDILNNIRGRAGATLLSKTGWDKISLRNQIKLERRMELSWEGHRFYDLRRWKDCETTLNGPIWGMKLENGAIKRKKVETRTFLNKLYRLPIPSNDVNGSGGKLVQNQGW